MDAEVPVLAGYLNIPTQSGFSLNRISKKKSSQRYCLLFKASRHGIERLEICESKEDKNPKIITMENCVKITHELSPANLIQIVKKTGTLTLYTLTDEDLKEWVNALQTVAFRDKGGTQCHKAAIEEDNDLYCSSYGDGLFVVTLIPSETSIRCNIEPKAYMLHLTATELQLKSAEDINVVLAKWPYRFIRKYGYRDGKFTFEAGRKCDTGEGIFTLDHTNPQEVFRCMSSKMKSMKKLIRGDTLNNIDCGENQLSAAASMEAGSRSPLPPSPCNQQVGDFEINSTQSCVSLRGFVSSSDSLNNFPFNSIPNNSIIAPQVHPVKHIPNKPPRKLLACPEKTTQSTVISNAPELKLINQPNCDILNKFQNYEPVSITTSVDPNKSAGSTVILNPQLVETLPPQLPVRNESSKTAAERDYESIENITDAWKTLGVNDVKHTERNMVVNDDLVNFFCPRALSPRKNSMKDLPSTITTKIIDIDIGEGDPSIGPEGNDVSYDRLDFLSPNNKNSSGYKTIVNVSPSTNSNRMHTNHSSNNDYEFIDSADMYPCRKADDSHQGYGILRKSSGSGSLQGLNVNVTNNNNNSVSAVNEHLILPGKSVASLNEPSPDHQSYNGLNYTIVSKPKRV